MIKKREKKSYLIWLFAAIAVIIASLFMFHSQNIEKPIAKNDLIINTTELITNCSKVKEMLKNISSPRIFCNETAFFQAIRNYGKP